MTSTAPDQINWAWIYIFIHDGFLSVLAYPDCLFSASSKQEVLVSSRRGFLSADLNDKSRNSSFDYPNRPSTNINRGKLSNSKERTVQQGNAPLRTKDEEWPSARELRGQQRSQTTVEARKRSDVKTGMRGRGLLTYPGCYAKEGAPYDKIAAHVSENIIHATQKSRRF